MKKFALFAAALTLCLFTVSHANAKDANQIEVDFFRAVADGQGDQAMEMMHPELKKLVDAPVLAAWSNAWKQRLGGFHSLKRTSTNYRLSLTGVEHRFESSVEFAEGKGNASLTIFNDTIVAFSLDSDALGNWFQGPTSINLYRERAERFLKSFFDKPADETRTLMHEALVKACENQKLESIMELVHSNGGQLQHAQLRSHKMQIADNDQRLILVFDLQCEKTNGECVIEFQFIGMKGHLMSFNFR